MPDSSEDEYEDAETELPSNLERRLGRVEQTQKQLQEQMSTDQASMIGLEFPHAIRREGKAGPYRTQLPRAHAPGLASLVGL